MFTRTTLRVWFSLMGPALLTAQTLPSAQAQGAEAAKPAAPLAQLDESRGCVVPFTYDPPVHPFVVVQVRINKSKPMPFIVDTGVQTGVVLMPWAAQELNLQTDKNTPQTPDANVTMQRVTSNCQVNILTLPGPTVDFNTNTVFVMPLPVVENATTPRIAGIIGMGLFRITTGRFDFDKKTLTFFADKHPPLTPSRPAVSLPMVQPDPDWLRVNLSLRAGKPTAFMLDTGSNTTTMPADAAAGLPHLAEGSTTADDAAGHHIVSELLLPSLALGDTSTPLVSVSLYPRGRQLQANMAILGMNVLSRFRVTIDTRNGFLTLEPRRRYSTPLNGDSDVGLEFKDGNTYLDQVQRRTDNPNIMAGERLLSIDGVDVNGQTYVETYLRLNGIAGTQATLTLEKPDHQKVTVSWLRRSHFPTIVASSLGLLLTKEVKQPMTVLAVVPGSQAEAAGLKAGDVVMTVNGASTPPLTFAALQTLFAADEHGATGVQKFTVRREKADAVLTFQLGKGSLHKS